MVLDLTLTVLKTFISKLPCEQVNVMVVSLPKTLAAAMVLKPTLYELAIGGTAVGTGLNAAPGMTEL